MTPRSLILAIDASPKRLGWAAVDYDSAELVTSGVEHTTDPNDLQDRRARIKYIAHEAMSRGDVCAAFVEDAYAGPSSRITVQHAMTVGNIEAFLLERWPLILVDRIAPATWRSILGIDPRGKTAPQRYADKHARRLIDSQDEADAICIAIAANKLIWRGSVA